MNPNADLAIIDHLLNASTAPPEQITTYTQWKRIWLSRSADWELPLDGALALGLAADRPAWAFAAGYQTAIQALAAPGKVKGLGAVCITEAGGPHPERIKTAWRVDVDKPGHWRLDGEKRFVSGAGAADSLYVAASTGRTGKGRNRLCMVVVDRAAPGLNIEALPPLEIVPELPHARVTLDRVLLSEENLLPGDGYLEAMKPFRTLEDLHVTAALLAWVYGVARRAGWPRETLCAILAQLVTARSLALAPPLAPQVHIVLGGFLEQAQVLMAGSDALWKSVPAGTRERWARDRKLLRIAQAARQRRFDVAWRQYGL